MSRKIGSRIAQGRSTHSQRTLERNVVLLDAADRIVGNGGLAVLENGGDIDGFPLDWSL